ncbi:hypothetical protein [Ralstonia solanacearum]|uniref:hypothetical protein n=1 Tax=Ralstonia solanacearum TaxID=305 RepID=UPI0006DC2A61|nr:hypothetical protein [Ralstonia solanacearum]
MKTATHNKLGAWFTRNELWLQTLISSFLIILVPTLVMTFAPEDQLPTWATALCLVIGCIGLLIAVVRALATDTLSALWFCFSASLFGWAIVIFQIVALLKH